MEKAKDWHKHAALQFQTHFPKESLDYKYLRAVFKDILCLDFSSVSSLGIVLDFCCCRRFLLILRNVELASYLAKTEFPDYFALGKTEKWCVGL